MSDLVQVRALKSFYFDGRIVSPHSDLFAVSKRDFPAYKARGLVAEVDPTPAAGAKSSASPAAPASPKQTAKKSARGALEKGPKKPTDWGATSLADRETYYEQAIKAGKRKKGERSS